MHKFTLPSDTYKSLFDTERVSKFNLVYADSKLFGNKKASLFLRTTPIIDVPLYVADPAYKTNISSFYPVYVGKIVLLGYLIFPNKPDSEFTIRPNKTIIRRKIAANEDFAKTFASKQMLLICSKSANLFIPSIKYEN